MWLLSAVKFNQVICGANARIMSLFVEQMCFEWESELFDLEILYGEQPEMIFCRFTKLVAGFIRP